MRHARALRRPALAVLAVVVLASCGDGEPVARGEYQQTVQRWIVEIEGGISRVSIELRRVEGGTGSLEDATAEAEVLRSSTSDAVSELDEVTPPRDADDAHVLLVRGLRGFALDLERFLRAVEERDVERVRVFVDGLERLPSVLTIRRASRDLEDAGYDVVAR